MKSNFLSVNLRHILGFCLLCLSVTLHAADAKPSVTGSPYKKKQLEKFLNTATEVAQKGRSLPAKPENVHSHLLGRELKLAPSFGRTEESFIGSGRVGGGGTLEGTWDHLIGPAY